MTEIDEWIKTCLRKKRLKPETADLIIMKAEKDGKKLRKYYCPHCFGYHLTKKPL